MNVIEWSKLCVFDPLEVRKDGLKYFFGTFRFLLLRYFKSIGRSDTTNEILNLHLLVHGNEYVGSIDNSGKLKSQ